MACLAGEPITFGLLRQARRLPHAVVAGERNRASTPANCAPNLFAPMFPALEAMSR